MTNLIIGVDPGLSGALALVDQDGLRDFADMPTALKGAGNGKVKNEVNAAALSALLRDWVNGRSDEVAVIVERVSSMPGQGVASMMSLGDTVGCIRGVVAARGYPLQWITPTQWKRRYAIGADKELARAKAIQLYPQAELARKKDHNRAEAILLARYGWEFMR